MRKKWSILMIIFLLNMILITSCSSFSFMSTEKSFQHDILLEGENLKGLKQSQVMEKIQIHALKINSEAEDAKLKATDWEMEKDEKIGKQVNAEKTMENLLNGAKGQNVKLVIEERKPTITTDYLQGNVREIGNFSTTILDQKISRVNNIEIAAEWINNVIVAPGEEFSFNSVLGKRTQQKGYEKAPIIVKTKDGPKKGSGIGGGICQISSTLYNAAMMAGMVITERHTHSKEVGYVPLGKDATVSYGSTDFKFKNVLHHPIMIKVKVLSDQLSVRILENRNKT